MTQQGIPVVHDGEDVNQIELGCSHGCLQWPPIERRLKKTFELVAQSYFLSDTQ